MSHIMAWKFFQQDILPAIFFSACAPEILTMNMTHAGELGYVFYIPNEFALHVYTSIVEAGRTFGLKHCGYYAMRAVKTYLSNTD